MQGSFPRNRRLIVMPVSFAYTREIVEESELNVYGKAYFLSGQFGSANGVVGKPELDA